jgi:hypothetical protein
MIRNDRYFLSLYFSLLLIVPCLVCTSCKKNNALTSINDVTKSLNWRIGGKKESRPITLTVGIDLGTMTDANSGWRQLLDAIKAADKYVNLDLSACTMNGTEFNPDCTVETGKNKIVNITLPLTAESIADGPRISGIGTFQHFTVLESFNGEGLTSIGESAFERCKSLTRIVLPDGLTEIGWDAFRECTGLTQITLPEGLTFINRGIFIDCTSLTQIILPQGITHIGQYAFEGCTGLKQIDLPQGVTYIGNLAFYGCESLTRIVLPEELSTIGEYVFSNCTGLTQVTLSAKLKSNYPAFSLFNGCSSLESFIVIGSGPLSAAIGGKALVENNTKLIAYPSASGSITLPEEISSIDEDAFKRCTDLTQITLPSEITSIGDAAFFGTGLTQITLPQKLTSIGRSAFESCENLSFVTCLAEHPPYLGKDAFKNTHANLVIKVPSDSVDMYNDYWYGGYWSEYGDKISAIEME